MLVQDTIAELNDRTERMSQREMLVLAVLDKVAEMQGVALRNSRHVEAGPWIPCRTGS